MLAGQDQLYRAQRLPVLAVIMIQYQWRRIDQWIQACGHENYMTYASGYCFMYTLPCQPASALLLMMTCSSQCLTAINAIFCFAGQFTRNGAYVITRQFNSAKFHYRPNYISLWPIHLRHWARTYNTHNTLDDVQKYIYIYKLVVHFTVRPI